MQHLPEDICLCYNNICKGILWMESFPYWWRTSPDKRTELKNETTIFKSKILLERTHDANTIFLQNREVSIDLYRCYYQKNSFFHPWICMASERTAARWQHYSESITKYNWVPTPSHLTKARSCWLLICPKPSKQFTTGSSYISSIRVAAPLKRGLVVSLS